MEFSLPTAAGGFTFPMNQPTMIIKNTPAENGFRDWLSSSTDTLQNESSSQSPRSAAASSIESLSPSALHPPIHLPCMLSNNRAPFAVTPGSNSLILR